MTSAPPAKDQRSRITFDEIEGFRITIPVDPGCLEILAFLSTSIAWTIGEVIFVSMFLLSFQGIRQIPENSIPLRALWAVGWTSLGLAALFWGIPWSGRREVIIIDGDELLIRRQDSSIGRAESYTLTRIRNLRYSPPIGPFSPGYSPSDRPHFAGSIAFDYDQSTIRFGPGLGETESRRLIRTIKDRYKFPDDRDEPLPVERL
jgi:hypothetical protein